MLSAPRLIPIQENVLAQRILHAETLLLHATVNIVLPTHCTKVNTIISCTKNWLIEILSLINIILAKTTFWTNNVPLERRLKMTSNAKWHVSCLEFHFGGRCSRKIAHAIKRGLGCVSKIYANQEVKRSKSAKESKYKLNCLLQQKVIFVGFQFLGINYLLLFSICIFFLSFVTTEELRLVT